MATTVVSMFASTSPEDVIARERALVLTGLGLLTGLAWLYLVSMASDMTQMGDAVLSASTASWSATEFGLMFVMWAIMMVGMMLPSATPMVLLFLAVNRRRRTSGRGGTPTAVFVGGYLVAWTAFSLGATALQWVLHEAGLLTPMMGTTHTLLGGAVLIAAGVYQWTPLKSRCLHHCQSPLQFITRHWRHGMAGAFRMGARHGLFCLGCCWVLMSLLFVGGVMNLLWVAGLTLFVLIEKIVPYRWVTLSSGLALVAWGATIWLRGAVGGIG